MKKHHDAIALIEKMRDGYLSLAKDWEKASKYYKKKDEHAAAEYSSATEDAMSKVRALDSSIAVLKADR